MKLILLIDDDEQIRYSFGIALRESGYRVIESDSGAAGLEMARQQMPDLILSDINMPGGGGQALLHEIRTDPDLGSKQVVLMTGRPDLVSPRNGMEQGADDFLVKPISKDALLSCMEARLKRADIHWRVEDRVVSKLRSSMTSQLPHEFTTPLAGIIGLSEILRDDFASLSSAEMQELHRDIHLSAMRLHRTSQNYLLMLELESGTTFSAKVEPPGLLSLARLKESLRTGVDLAVERHGRKEDLTMHIDNCAVVAEAWDVTKIAEELVDNALKFSRAGTPIEIRLGSDGVLSVTDAGRGMSSEEIEQIGAFRQFNRKKYEQQGLGLGLILVQRLAARNGATFSIVSRPGQGVQGRLSFRLETPAPFKREGTSSQFTRSADVPACQK